MYKITKAQKLKLKHTMALLNSMVNGGESHSKQSKRCFQEALGVINNLPTCGNKQKASIVNYVPYQVCPKCLGDGNLLRHNSPPILGTNAIPICDVCLGQKIIPMTALYNLKTGGDGNDNQ